MYDKKGKEQNPHVPLKTNNCVVVISSSTWCRACQEPHKEYECAIFNDLANNVQVENPEEHVDEPGGTSNAMWTDEVIKWRILIRSSPNLELIQGRYCLCPIVGLLH
jgi:hypothetical protein